MANARIKIIALAIFGLAAPFWWTMLLSKLIYGLYLFGGAPERPSPLFAWSNLLLPSIGLGLLTGVVVLFLSRSRPLVGWAVFFAFLVLGLVAYAIYLGSVKPLVSAFGSFSNLSFLVASVLVPLWAVFQSGSGLTSAWSRTR
jgi:hypothetical protein